MSSRPPLQDDLAALDVSSPDGVVGRREPDQGDLYYCDLLADILARVAVVAEEVRLGEVGTALLVLEDLEVELEAHVARERQCLGWAA